STNENSSKPASNAEERRVTLLARCNAYLEDANNTYKIDTEKYKLESVESILESFEARAAERINKKFNINTSTHENNEPSKVNVNSTQTAKKSTIVASVPNAPTTCAVTPSLSDTVVFDTGLKTIADVYKEPAKEVKHIFTANTASTPQASLLNDELSSTKIVSDIIGSSNPTEISSTSKTTVFQAVEPVIKVTNTEEYVENVNSQKDEVKSSIDDYESLSDRQRVLKSLVKKKNSFNFKLLISFICFLVALIIATPLSASFALSSATINIIDLVICFLVAITNFGSLSGIKSLFSSKVKSSLPTALSIISASLFSIINLIFNGSLIGLSSIAALSLVSYNLANKNFYSHAIKNFNLIATTEFKNAVTIIQNKKATKTIVGNSIDGSALVCCGGETTNTHNFLKYTFCDNPILSKIQKVSFIGFIIALILATTTFVLNSADFIFPIYLFCVTICFCAIPSVFHIVSLTINSANKRLNHYDAMITGYQAADELELCNAVALSCDSLFPEGTVRLVDMKLLGPNPFDQSMLDAAAISSAIHSPLAGIFKQMDISKDYNSITQEVDTVIYEEKMGVSGWVNDRRVFIGNRDLLIAHGFSNLPPAELDKKIMRKGYFPVYIASDNVACALLVVKYEPDNDIIYEMQRLANTGTTILVDNCDPNINSQMLTDYFKLFDDTIFVMNKQGSDFYKAATQHKEDRNAGAVFKTKVEGLLSVLTASINIKKHISRMTIFYITGVVLGLLLLFTALLTSLTSYISPVYIILVQLVLTATTLLPTVLRKP
ncbi:MAG: hypothetical protein IJD90_03825, partial [Clostridia bacterium]|nr:hypothetical protein [Clostridia bacterium]